MVPDSPESRLARHEERISANQRQIEMLGPLPLQVGLVQRGQEELREDIVQLRKDMDRRFEHQDQKLDRWQEKFERSVGNQFATCQNEIAKLSESVRNHHRAERERREAEREKAMRSKFEQRIAKYGPGATVVAALVAFMGSIVTVLWGG